MDRQHRLRHVRLQVLFAQPPDPGRGQARHPRRIGPAFRGDRTRWNPEDLLVGSLSACHKLWYLHLCAVEGVRVLSYRDEAEGLMAGDPERGGAFTRVVLRPVVGVAPGADTALAAALHERAHHFCYIANSVNFPVLCEPRIVEEG